jgi:hypothetical protein
MNDKWEEFRAAHAAWETATQAFHQAIRTLLDNGPTEYIDISHLIENMEKTKLRFEVAAKPFTGSR